MITRILLFFRAVRILLREGGAWQTLEEDWSPQDQFGLASFIGGQGKIFMIRLRTMSLAHNSSAVQKADPKSCGFAAGYMACIADIQLLSEFTADDSLGEVVPEAQDDGDPEYLSKLTSVFRT